MSRHVWILALALLLAAGCRRGERRSFVTYFNGEQRVSVRYPSEWRTDQAEQEGIWYRYFLAPPAAPQNKAPVSVTLLAGPLSSSIDEYARSYLAGNKVVSVSDDSRQGAKGRTWTYASPDGATRHRLLLVASNGRFWGLYAQGEAAAFDEHTSSLDEMWKSFTLERPELYPVRRWDRFGVSLGVPPSWRETRKFSGSGTLLVQFTSPALAVQRGQTVHASLTMTVEQIPEQSGIDEFYKAARTRLGDNLRLLAHEDWNGGFADLMRTETSVAVSYVKRFYRTQGRRGTALAFEGRDDIFWRIETWPDLIASTLKMDPQAPADR